MSNMGGETLLTLINNVLDFSKLEAGKMDLESSGFDLLRTVEDCGKLVARARRRRPRRRSPSASKSGIPAVGITLDVQPRLFQAFSQADASTTRRGLRGAAVEVRKHAVAG